jgi:hypothetical protein
VLSREEKRQAKQEQNDRNRQALFGSGGGTRAVAESREGVLWQDAVRSTESLTTTTGDQLQAVYGRHEQTREMERQARMQQEILQTAERVRNAGSFFGRITNWWNGLADNEVSDYSLPPEEKHPVSQGSEAVDMVIDGLNRTKAQIQRQNDLLQKQNAALDLIQTQVEKNQDHTKKLTRQMKYQG